MYEVLVFAFLTLACLLLLRHFFVRTVLDNVPGPSPSSFWSGCEREFRNPRAWGFHQKLMETYGGLSRLKGALGSNILIVSDPKAVHHILIKDFDFYEEKLSIINGNRVLFGEGILSSIGDRHRAHRKMLSPAFSIAYMREMVPIFYEVGHKLRETFLQKVANGPTEVDVVAWMGRCALELIGRSGLGYSFDTLAENSEPHEFVHAAKQLMPLAKKTSFLVSDFINTLSKIGTARFRRAIVDLIPSESAKQLRDIVDVFHKTSTEIIEAKRAALRGDEVLATQIGRGNDVISILMRENMEASEEDKLSEAELIGQVTSLTFAATDTTSSAVSRILHLLALHKDVQAKLRAEIIEAKKENRGEDLGYDNLVTLPYLDAICRETLRLYPPVSQVIREPLRDVVLPLGVPIKGINGKEINALPIPKGTPVYVSIISSNRNPELWGPDAHEWKPERWLNPLPESLINAHISGVYSHLLTFTGGGRSCIGFNFSLLEMKVVLVLLLDRIEFSLGDRAIVWQMNPIATPNIDMNSTIPTLPMKLSLASCNTQM